MDNIDSILQNLGLHQLSDMQENAVALIRANRNVVLLAPTGSGKTLAFLLPLTEAIDKTRDEVQALILSPTRELALQTLNVLNAMKTGVRALCCYGGRPAMDEHRKINALHPQIIIGTPGRLNDHIDKQNFSTAAIRTLVVDEFDKMFELNFQDEVESLLGKVPRRERCILASATNMPEIPTFAGFRNQPPAMLNFLVRENGTVDTKIRHFIVRSEQKDKLLTASRLLCLLGVKQSILFVNYREAAERVAQWLIHEGHSVSLFHGGLEQTDREAALNLFRSGSANVLVSTELAARGIDIPALQNVIHYHLPANPEAYIHRCGRTARWDTDGNSFLIVGPEEQVPKYPDVQFEQFPLQPPYPTPAKPEWAMLYIGRGKRDKLSKGDIVGFLCKTGRIKATDIGVIDVKERYAHVAVRRSELKQLMLHIIGEKIKKMTTRIESVAQKQPHNAVKK